MTGSPNFVVHNRCRHTSITVTAFCYPQAANVFRSSNLSLLHTLSTFAKHSHPLLLSSTLETHKKTRFSLRSPIPKKQPFHTTRYEPPHSHPTLIPTYTPQNHAAIPYNQNQNQLNGLEPQSLSPKLSALKLSLTTTRPINKKSAQTVKKKRATNSIANPQKSRYLRFQTSPSWLHPPSYVPPSPLPFPTLSSFSPASYMAPLLYSQDYKIPTTLSETQHPPPFFSPPIPHPPKPASQPFPHPHPPNPMLPQPHPPKPDPHI